ncbi:MAG: SDR family oxidoreductase [Candidatus Omnitrophica bacterium]|nr:SDR family oxidoreductase [Candidatus Omnitrophota bacterium]
MNLFSLEGRHALVTGSSQGIGHSIANALCDAGATTIFHGVQDESEIEAVDHPYIQKDLLVEEGPEELLEEAFAISPTLDLLVSNAGSFFDPPFREMTKESWSKTIALNLTSPYLLVHGFGKRLIEQGRSGAVVIVASTNAVQSEKDSVAYDASKGGLAAMVRSFALDLASHGIRVNGLAPGLIKTPLTDVWMRTRPDILKHYDHTIPLGRVGKPDDCAGAAVFLCSPAAEYITGHILTIDGGLTAQQIGPPPA